ncbi:MAG: PLDc N-terminal domain-containing protein [Sphingobacteriales bacterium]|nr:PLDc N-terminal domain-containing protein [Sphingobacteriales bacterium]
METASLLILAVAAIALGIYLWAVIDLNRRAFSSESERRNWVNLIYFLPLLGAVYYLFRRNKRRRSI